MTARDDLVERLDELEDAVTPATDTDDAEIPDAVRDALREALDYRYSHPDAFPTNIWDDTDAQREFIETAADHIDEPHSSVLVELAGGTA